MSNPKPSSSSAPPSAESVPPTTPDPNRFRLTEEEKARVLGQTRKVLQLSGVLVNPITPTPAATQ